MAHIVHDIEIAKRIARNRVGAFGDVR